MMRILQIKEKIYDEMVGTKVNRSLDADKTIEITIGEAHGPVKSILKSLSCWVDPQHMMVNFKIDLRLVVFISLLLHPLWSNPQYTAGFFVHHISFIAVRRFLRDKVL